MKRLTILALFIFSVLTFTSCSSYRRGCQAHHGMSGY